MLINENDFHTNGLFHAPFYIFIKYGFRQLHDRDLLNIFQLERFNKENPHRSNSVVHFSQDDTWLHIMDDWGYQLYFNPTVSLQISKLSRSFDIFHCSIGDTDASFDFSYYQNGHLIRKYVVTDPNYKGPVVTEDIGAPLAGEHFALQHPDEVDKVISLAHTLGIHTNHQELGIRSHEYFYQY